MTTFATDRLADQRRQGLLAEANALPADPDPPGAAHPASQRDPAQCHGADPVSIAGRGRSAVNRDEEHSSVGAGPADDTPETVTAPEPLDVIVIGAGQAGLAIAWHLRRQGVRFVVLDAADRVGHTWRSRWDSLRLFTPARYSALPGMAFPGDPGHYPTKDAVADYLHRYASEFDLPIRLNTAVTGLVRQGTTFEVSTPRQTLRARQVIVAAGPFQTPVIPSVSTRLGMQVVALHSSAYRNPDQLPAGPVLVVGAGNSGMQIAEEIAASRPVALSAGETPAALPQRLLGRDLFWWLTRSGLMRLSGDSRLGRRLRARGELLVGSSRRRLERAGVSFRPRLTSMCGDTAHFSDGTSTEVATVIWATGFRRNYSWINIRGAAVDGQVVHDRGVSPIHGLYFLGMPWQHTRGSALLGFVQADAAYLASRLTTSERPGAGRAARPVASWL